MKQYRVIYDRKGCIGAAACVAGHDARWVLVDDGKADLKGAQLNKEGLFELIIDENELPKMMDAAQLCPVLVIHIDEVETGKRLI
ncbi:ferredoxin [Candidatus Woesearchaeota archaeon]|nr:ferredoxin [Candidatus Woesearchaeota archaeon]